MMIYKLFFLFLCFVVAPCSAQTVLYVANDMGRNGYYLQRPIAELMGRMAEEDGPEAVLALGDIHHFEGVASTDDPLWLTNFEHVYAHPELMLPWWVVAGNHEYRGNTQAFRDYSRVSRRWQAPARYYTRVFDGLLRVIFLDTTPLIDRYTQERATYPDAAHRHAKRQLRWLRRTLQKARERWVVVVGHHPVYADTGKDTCERADMQRRVEPLLRRYGASMYISGHIHNFQHITQPGSPVQYVVNSSASLSRPKVKAIPGTVFCSGAAGFSRLTATTDTLRLEMIDEKGTVIHTVYAAPHPAAAWSAGFQPANR